MAGMRSDSGGREKGREEEESGRGKNVISPLFSLINQLKPVRGVMWPNFTEPDVFWQNAPKWLSAGEGPSLWMSNRQLSQFPNGPKRYST